MALEGEKVDKKIKEAFYNKIVCGFFIKIFHKYILIVLFPVLMVLYGSDYTMWV